MVSLPKFIELFDYLWRQMYNIVIITFITICPFFCLSIYRPIRLSFKISIYLILLWANLLDHLFDSFINLVLALTFENISLQMNDHLPRPEKLRNKKMIEVRKGILLGVYKPLRIYPLFLILLLISDLLKYFLVRTFT